MKLLLPILLIVTFLRFFQLSSTPSGLYWDELDTGYQAYSLLHTGRDYFGHPFPAHLQSFADYRSSLYMYLTVPVVKYFGLSAMSVRLTAVIFSLLTILVIYYLSRKFLKLPVANAWIPAAVWGFSPWVLVQGRIAAESMIMPVFLLLGLAYFLKFLSQGRGMGLSAVFFALSLWTYGTAKLFLPLLLLILVCSYWSKLKSRLKIGDLFSFFIIFLFIASPVIVEIVTKNISFRFNELSVFTDPVTSSEVDFSRLESSLGGGARRTLGMQPPVLEKLVYNKYSFWLTRLIGNYSQALSSDFLFTSGDPQLRHHADQPNTGQFYLVELLPFLLGLMILLRSGISQSDKKLLLGWLILAPLPSVITRDGGNHAPRLLPLLPPLVFIISLGVNYLISLRLGRFLYLPVYALSVFLAVFYLFTVYRVKSAASFNTGFTEAIRYANLHAAGYDRVIFDGHNESFLMAYLFVNHPDPAVFQQSFPLPSGQVTNGVEGYLFGRTFILYPGTRDWTKLSPGGRNLIITTADQPASGHVTKLADFPNPDGSAAVTALVN